MDEQGISSLMKSHALNSGTNLNISNGACAKIARTIVDVQQQWHLYVEQ